MGRWALEFATVSFGDPLLASAIAILLLPQMPEGVQVSFHISPYMDSNPGVAVSLMHTFFPAQ